MITLTVRNGYVHAPIKNLSLYLPFVYIFEYFLLNNYILTYFFLYKCFCATKYFYSSFIGLEQHNEHLNIDQNVSLKDLLIIQYNMKLIEPLIKTIISNNSPINE